MARCVDAAAIAGVFDAHDRYYRLVEQTPPTGSRDGLTPLDAARACDLGEFAEWADAERLVLNLHRAYADADGGELDLLAAMIDAMTFNGGPLTTHVCDHAACTFSGRSAGEHRRVVGERLELQGVAGRVAEEHRPLLARLPGEAQVGLDDERRRRPRAPGRRARGTRRRRGSPRSAAPGRRGRRRGWPPLRRRRRQVGDELVAVEVPVDPGVGLATLRAPQHAAVEAARRGEVVDGNGEVEAGATHDATLRVAATKEERP